MIKIQDEKILAIIKEAAETQAIASITADQRRQIAYYSSAYLNDPINIWCDGCVIRACYNLAQELNKSTNTKNKKG